MKLYHDRQRRANPEQIASLHPVQTPDTTMTVRSSPSSETILNRSSMGRSFHPSKATPSICPLPSATMRFLNQKSKFPVTGLPPTISIKLKLLQTNRNFSQFWSLIAKIRKFKFNKIKTCNQSQVKTWRKGKQRSQIQISGWQDCLNHHH